MNILRGLIVGFLGFLGGSCTDSDQEPDFVILTYDYDFSQTDHGWEGGFSNYATTDSISEYGVTVEYTDLPANLGPKKGWMFSGNNTAGDLFMFMKKKISSIDPNTEYTIAFDIEFASNVPNNSGLQATNVFLKAGASANEPKKVVDGNFYTLSIDKGRNGTGGTDMIVVGDIGKDDTTSDYNIVARNNTASFSVKSNNSGELWLIVGVDSGFAGTTTIYLTNISVVFSIAN